MGFAGWLAGGIISGVWRRCSVRAVLDIHEYYLRSVLGRTLRCLLLTPQANSMRLSGQPSGKGVPVRLGSSGGSA